MRISPSREIEAGEHRIVVGGDISAAIADDFVAPRHQRQCTGSEHVITPHGWKFAVRVASCWDGRRFVKVQRVTDIYPACSINAAIA